VDHHPTISNTAKIGKYSHFALFVGLEKAAEWPCGVPVEPHRSMRISVESRALVRPKINDNVLHPGDGVRSHNILLIAAQERFQNDLGEESAVIDRLN
jgi:hypothetical protein